MTMTRGYPATAAIETILDAEGIEEISENNPNFRVEFLQFLWSLLNRDSHVGALGVYCSSTISFNVRGGKYNYRGVVKTYTPGDNQDPTNNDTTYIWLKSDNTIDYDIDGNGWPAAEHIKLAEIDVDAAGIITAVRDLRGETFMQYLANYTNESGTSVEVLPVHWDKGTPVVNDEIRLPFYAENSAGVKTEYARLVIKLTDVVNGQESAEMKLSRIKDGTLTDIGQLICLEEIVCCDNDIICYENEPVIF